MTSSGPSASTRLAGTGTFAAVGAAQGISQGSGAEGAALTGREAVDDLEPVGMSREDIGDPVTFDAGALNCLTQFEQIVGCRNGNQHVATGTQDPPAFGWIPAPVHRQDQRDAAVEQR